MPHSSLLTTKVYLLLGSNEGNRLEWFDKAMDLLRAGGCVVVAQSAVYETAAWGKEDQPDFLNMALCVATTLLPLQLLALTQSIEHQLGRQRTVKWGQRTLDIDILLYGNEVVDTPALQVPHPQLPNRRFALVPLADVAANLVHPTLHTTISGLLAVCPDALAVRKYEF
ncbi:2-amino-4-hydroxy-6-hydroxymethyldihydropteridine diphosphokinase [Chitinophagaceae bacterium IBVUCB1]|nr:2-amino-4-hydroxy-6-hydroxymethyldihydropteridine diphosphokinase [Chitinophagaceae bacterium IBVUCB1]